MKKVISILAAIVVSIGMLLPTMSHAYREEGNYFMAQTGNSRQDITSDTVADDAFTIHSSVDKKTGIPLRGAFGRRFHRNFAGEIGVTKYADAKWDVSCVGCSDGDVTGDVKNEVIALDFNAVGLLPVSQTVTLYAKGGVAALHRKIDSSLDIVEGNTSEHVNGKKDKNLLRPTVALGLTYEINDRWDVDFMASRLLGKSKSNVHSTSYLPNVDLFVIGAVYNMA